MNRCECELSVVIPCLNEADTLESCIRKAQTAMREHGIDGEVIVADNGSTDGSKEIADRVGAIVVEVPSKGYGSALMGGIEAAQGKFIIMGDADDSYDFLEIPKFMAKLREGNDLVQGCRLPAGGGRVAPGAMPFLHRWLGNPMFSLLARLFFHAPIHDIYCGLRGFTKALYKRLDQRCTGMEFATEMIIKSSLLGEKISEVPITLHPDGRKSHTPHLRTFRDGWRTLRFFMLYSPRWLYLIPGVALMLIGIIGYLGVAILAEAFRPHSLLVLSMITAIGYQSVLFALLAKTFAISEGLLPMDEKVDRFFKVATLERALLLSAFIFLVGIGLLCKATYHWWELGFGPLDYSYTLQLVIPGVTLGAIGFQSIMASFFVSILGLKRK